MPTDNSQHIKPQGGALDESIDPQEYARLLDLYDSSFRNIAEGEVVKGTVLKVTPSEVIVDVGYKSEGLIAIDEFVDETGQIAVQPGDIVDVLLERTEDRDGYVVLSREKAEKMKIWDDVEKAYAERKVVIGRVIERIKGGSPSTSACVRSCPDRRSTSVPFVTSMPCADRNCACASSR
jgi:small subunit ribosomal protein S1